MPLLILLALGLGVVLATYEFSPRAHSRIDAFLRSLREAQTAHQAAEAHLENTRSAVDVTVRHVQTAVATHPVPTTGIQAARITADAAVEHVLAATAANQEAAQHTAEAAKIAQTGAERSAVTDSAVKVLERKKRIDEALANLGVGQCGVRSYERVTSQIRDLILQKLHTEGMTVTGNDPWDIDTQIAGVKLRAVWDPEMQVLKLIVTASSLLAPCQIIWQQIDGALRGIIGS